MDEKDLVVYVHGKGGSPEESGHYRPLFPDCEVIGLDYRTFTPWETGPEIRKAVEDLRPGHGGVTLVANSIGAYFCLHAGLGGLVERAFFISPVVDMEKLICDMLRRAGIAEAELRARGAVRTDLGEDLSWDWLRYVRSHPIRWDVPTRILYGGRDALTSFETVSGFAERHGAELTVMEDGEHWFHTEEQLRFLDDWIRGAAAGEPGGRPSGLRPV